MLATLVPLILLSAAMEMLEHLDATQQHFAMAPVWTNINAADFRIAKHPLHHKARAITIARKLSFNMGQLSTNAADTAVNFTQAPSNGVVVPAPSAIKPKWKPI